MDLSGNRIRYFFFSQYLADGVRITLEIVLPVIICAQLGHINIGYTIALGALAVSISDAPGPVEHKRNGMLYCMLFIFIMALLTGFVNGNVILMGLLILFASFFFTMFSIYGNRAASIGTAALLVMILRLSTVATPMEALINSLLILGGGAWYMAIALLFFSITPYRPEQRALGDCIHETAKFLRLKADFYDNKPNYAEAYHQLVTQQVRVNEKQDALRELLYKNRDLIEESSHKGKLLILTFADVMELYEQITATWYDYESLRERFGGTGVLEQTGDLIRKIADELDNIGLAIQSDIAGKKQVDLLTDLENLKATIDALSDADSGNMILKKILVNLRNIGRRVDDLYNYFNAAKNVKRSLQSGKYYQSFVSHQQIDLALFRNNLHMNSSIFRHSLRMMITCMAGFLIAKLISYGHHSYWILLTIIIILKPGFGLSKERNIHRITGTFLGGIIGIGIVAFIHDRDILFTILVFCMVGTYTFVRINYIVMVIFTTPYIVILFNLLGMPFWDIARERLLDTGIGCALAFMASYLLFPQWESSQLYTYMNNVLKANIDYLRKLKTMMCGNEVPVLEYKLVRKELYVSIANLSAAFHRMLSDPESKQQNRQQIDQFVVLNHIFSSNVVSLTAGVRESEVTTYPKEVLTKLKKSIYAMEETLQVLDPAYVPELSETTGMETNPAFKASHDQLSNQLDFINKVAMDINKLAKQATGKT